MFFSYIIYIFSVYNNLFNRIVEPVVFHGFQPLSPLPASPLCTWSSWICFSSPNKATRSQHCSKNTGQSPLSTQAPLKALPDHLQNRVWAQCPYQGVGGVCVCYIQCVFSNLKILEILDAVASLLLCGYYPCIIFTRRAVYECFDGRLIKREKGKERHQ